MQEVWTYCLMAVHVSCLLYFCDRGCIRTFTWNLWPWKSFIFLPGLCCMKTFLFYLSQYNKTVARAGTDTETICNVQSWIMYFQFFIRKVGSLYTFCHIHFICKWSVNSVMATEFCKICHKKNNSDKKKSNNCHFKTIKPEGQRSSLQLPLVCFVHIRLFYRNGPRQKWVPIPNVEKFRNIFRVLEPLKEYLLTNMVEREPEVLQIVVDHLGIKLQVTQGWVSLRVSDFGSVFQLLQFCGISNRFILRSLSVMCRLCSVVVPVLSGSASVLHMILGLGVIL